MKRILLLGLSVIPLSFLLSSCTTTGGTVVVGDEPVIVAKKKGGPPPHAKAHGWRAKHRYWYYPSAQVYFDIGRKIYFYLEAGGWRSAAKLPSGIVVGSSYVEMDMDSDKPYLDHGKHKGKYPPGQMKKKGKKNKNFD